MTATDPTFTPYGFTHWALPALTVVGAVLLVRFGRRQEIRSECRRQLGRDRLRCPVDAGAIDACLAENSIQWNLISGAELNRWAGAPPVLTDDYAPSMSCSLRIQIVR
jgi:hypothetical protein